MWLGMRQPARPERQSHPSPPEGTRDSGKPDSEAHWICHRCHRAMTGTGTSGAPTGPGNLGSCLWQPAKFNFDNSAARCCHCTPAPALAPSGPSASLVHSSQNSSCHSQERKDRDTACTPLA